MQYTIAIVLAVASLTTAQSTTSSAATSSASGSLPGCGSSIDAIVTNCLASTGLRVSSCDSQDWNCLCDNQRAVLTCYDNCPSDPNRFGAEQTSVSWCNSAKAYGSSTSSASSSPSSSSNATTTSPTSSGSSSATATDAETTETDSSSSTSTSAVRSSASSASSSAASATDSAAGNVVLPAGAGGVGGILAVVFGVVAAVL